VQKALFNCSVSCFMSASQVLRPAARQIFQPFHKLPAEKAHSAIHPAKWNLPPCHHAAHRCCSLAHQCSGAVHVQKQTVDFVSLSLGVH
jgi:hypothetical protein